MHFSVGASLPEHRIKASIDSVDSSNRIQDDEYARRYGFRAGLVPGVSIFAYMSRPLIELMGREWLERGSAEVHFLRPIYEGEEIHVGGVITSVADDGALSLDYRASNNQGATCGIGVAKLPPQKVAPEPSLEDYPAGRAKLNRPMSLDTLQVGESLAPVVSEFNWNIHWQYCRKTIRDHHPLYERMMHPGWLANRASQILAVNYGISAWIDVSSYVQNLNLLEEECTIETRGRVYDKFERDGDHYVVLDLAVFAPQRCLATLRYTAIFRIAPNAA
ncbi:MAG: MaoC family dehydratase [Acidobacteria bacterium]|nr:MaoC family dehydratase [Acidobacteriota bacterium]